MKKNISILILGAALVLASSCQKDEAQAVSGLSKLSFKAETSKTALESNGAITWKSSDKIGIFSGSSIYEFSTSESGASVTFTGSAPSADCYYAVYPYSSTATLSGSKITTIIPTEQAAVKNGIADNANVTVAYTEDQSLSFKNICGILRFTITRDDIKKVEFSGGNSEKVAGTVEISVSDTPSFTAESGSTSAALIAAGDALVPGEYNLLVLPQTYAGFTLKFTDKDGNTDTRSTNNDLVISRSSGKDLGDVDTDIFQPVVYSFDLNTVDFADSFIYDVKDASGDVIAVVCKEYLGTEANQQAVTVYGTKPLNDTRSMDSVTPVCLVAQVLKTASTGDYQTYTDADAAAAIHGGRFSFQNGSTGYTTEGTKAAIKTVYITYDKKTGITTVSDEAASGAVAATATPRTLVLSDRGETNGYKLVKINRLIWMAENLHTAKYNDGTDITKVKAAELQTATAAAHVQANSASYAYNGDAVLTGKLGTEDGWGVPSKSDVETMYKFCGTLSYTLNFAHNNVSGFSSRYPGRVTSKWDSSLDPCFWCSNAMASNKMTCLVIRTAGTAPTATTQSYKFGFWIRLKHILY